MDRQSELSIIIVNWNSKDYVRKCVQSICANTRDVTFEIVVVDGGSFDGCGEMLAREFPDVHFVQCEKNVGFARANNIGFAHSTGKSLLFLNPDTEVNGAAINILLRALEMPDAGIIGARLLNTDGTVQTTSIQPYPTIFNQCFNVEVLRQTFPRQWGIAPLFSEEQKPHPAEVLSGACMMLRRRVFEQIGKFSEDYFMYAEDLDLCYKANRAGLKNYHVPGALIIHHGGGSSQKSRSAFSDVMMRESVFRFLAKARGKFYGTGYRVTMGVNAIGRLAVLTLLFPLKMVRGDVAAASNSFQRWIAILKWTLGLESWVAKYYEA